MKEPITKELFDEWDVLIKKAGQLEAKIEARITYILKTYFKIFGNKLDTWYFCGAEEGEVGDLKSHIWGDQIWSFEVDSSGKDWEMAFIDKDGNECYWENSIPTRWLFEDFETEIKEGKELFQKRQFEKELKRKASIEKRKMQKQQLIDSAKSKLSQDELKALGVKK